MMTDDTNKVDEPEDFSSLTSAAERMLSEAFNSPIHFSNIERLSEPERRNLILRCTSAATSSFPSSFIIKKVEAELVSAG